MISTTHDACMASACAAENSLCSTQGPPPSRFEGAVLQVGTSPRLISVVLTFPQRATDLVLERHQTKVVDTLWGRLVGKSEE